MHFNVHYSFNLTKLFWTPLLLQKTFWSPLSATQNFFGPPPFCPAPHQSIYEHSLSFLSIEAHVIDVTRLWKYNAILTKGRRERNFYFNFYSKYFEVWIYTILNKTIFCDVIKPNQSEVGNIDLQPNKGNNSLCFLWLSKLLSAHISGTICPLHLGFLQNVAFANSVCYQVEKINLVFPDLRPISLHHTSFS